MSTNYKLRYGIDENHPAYYVSWYDALVYCNKRSIAEGLTPCYSILNSTETDERGTVTWDAVECDYCRSNIGFRVVPSCALGIGATPKAYFA